MSTQRFKTGPEPKTRLGAADRWLRQLSTPQRRFICAVRDSVQPLVTLLKKHGIDEKRFIRWMRGPTFKCAMGKALIEMDRIGDVDLRMAARSAKRYIAEEIRKKPAKRERYDQLCGLTVQLENRARTARASVGRSEKLRKQRDRREARAAGEEPAEIVLPPGLSEEEADRLLLALESVPDLPPPGQTGAPQMKTDGHR